MTTVAEATKALDVLIANKRKYLATKPNTFLEKEITSLVSINILLSNMEHLVSVTQTSYKLLLANYEKEFEGRLTKAQFNHEEFSDFLKRTTAS